MKRITMSVRVTPNTHAAIKRMAEREGLPINTWVKESLLLRIGWALGVEAGVLSIGGDTVLQDEQVRQAVLMLLREWDE